MGSRPVLRRGRCEAAEYERVPRDLQARVLGWLGAVAWAGIPFGALLAGLLVQAADLRTALAADGPPPDPVARPGAGGAGDWGAVGVNRTLSCTGAACGGR